MKARIKVIGKDQNRTALGIINAYLKLYPNATLADLQKAFPASLNTNGPAGEVVVPIAEAKKRPDDYFLKEDELIRLKNGQTVALKYLWTKDDYQAIEKHAKEFGILADKVAETAPFKEGCYKLEMLDNEPEVIPVGIVEEVTIIEEVIPVVEEIEVIEIDEVPEKKRPTVQHAKANTTPPPTPKKKKSHAWIWWLLGLLLLLLALLLWKRCDDKKVTKESFNTVVVEDVYAKSPYTPLREEKIATATIDINGDLVYDKSGKLIKVVIENETIDLDEYTTEAEIYAFLLSSDKKSDWIVLDQVHFKFNEVNFTDAALKQINYVTSILKKYDPTAKIEIEGFADHIGTDPENQKISDERAEATANHFANDGFPRANILSAVGLRDTKRLCQQDDTPACRALNRRAEIRITK